MHKQFFSSFSHQGGETKRDEMGEMAKLGSECYQDGCPQMKGTSLEAFPKVCCVTSSLFFYLKNLGCLKGDFDYNGKGI